ncbi:MAG: tRNA adenosine(34) deaminase TadA [Anaerotardibacter sp.]
MKNDENLDIAFINEAIAEAKKAEALNEVPIGAVVVYDGKIIARAYNRRETDKDPAGHAEFLAMKKAAEYLDTWRLTGCTVYVTLEPCIMCSGLMHQSRIDRCVYGAPDPKAGALGTLYSVHEDTRLNHNFEVTSGILAEECGQLLSNFFSRRRQERKAQKLLEKNSLS